MSNDEYQHQATWKEKSFTVFQVTTSEGHKIWYKDRETYEKMCKILNDFWEPLEYKLMFGDDKNITDGKR